MNRIRTATIAALLASFVGLQAVPAIAADDQARNRRDRQEDRRDRREDRRDRMEDRRDRLEDRRDRIEDRRDRREDYWDRRDDYRYRRDARWNSWNLPHRAIVRPVGWDAARYYRNDASRYRPRRLGRNDRIYRGSDNRYYCERDDGTTGLIIGGVAGGVLGNIITPGNSKTIGTIIGAGAGALIGRAIDDGDIVCR